MNKKAVWSTLGVLFGFLVAIFIFWPSDTVSADTGPQTDPVILKQLKEFSDQLKELQGLVKNQNEVIKSQAVEIEALKTVREAEHTVSVPATGAVAEKKLEVPSWLDGMKQGGGIRLRYEAFDMHGGTDQDRNRFRVKLTYGIDKKLGEDFTVGFRLATGGTTDPTSSNQTLTGNFVYKTVVFDKLYAKYVPSQLKDFGPIQQVELGGGKTDNPFLRGSSPMVWDHDVMPEGIYETIDFKAVDLGEAKISLFLIGGQFPLVENAGAGLTDAELYAVMGGFNLEADVAGFEKPIGWTSAFAYYDYRDYARNANFGAFARGNTATATALTAGDFNVINIYNQLKIPTAWVSVAPFFDYAHNLGDTVEDFKPISLDDAWGLGLKLGEAKKKGEWEAAYAYYFI
ncbi:MAG: putative porin, partial [Candidatus Omnitrophica bacterium]|nr:putative porin [Candidatus Omnitrophota bacterium]